ncbi:MAG: hypothetical protein PUC40_07515 [Lachnospiraceae bacterium]|nr:hypothetical protein [Lachnospiraceae bacterium]MDD6380901.1 hypothetical protein [Lachnospiraceae bacterium]
MAKSNTNKIRQTYGSILKSESEAHGLTREGFAKVSQVIKRRDFVGYEDEKINSIRSTVSNIFKGYTFLHDNEFNALSEAWGLREDYLRGKSNLRTDQDILSLISDQCEEIQRHDYEVIPNMSQFFKVMGYKLTEIPASDPLSENPKINIYNENGELLNSSPLALFDVFNFYCSLRRINRDMIQSFFPFHARTNNPWQ